MSYVNSLSYYKSKITYASSKKELFSGYRIQEKLQFMQSNVGYPFNYNIETML